MNGRPWTKTEVTIIRKYYAEVGARDLADALERPCSSVYQKAALLGVAKKVPPMSAQERATITRMARQGACNRCIGRAIGRARSTVRFWRRKLGIALQSGGSVGTCKSCIAKVRATTKRQCREAGVQNLAQIRAQAYRKYAVENGWPEYLRPREVQILNALAARGVPMTRLELAQAVGMRTDRMGANGTLALLASCNGPGGTYTASLLRYGLIESIKRGAAVHDQGSGRSRDLYYLSPKAIAILEERACQKEMGVGRSA